MNHDQFHSKLQDARTTSELNALLQQYLASHRISTYSFTYYSYHPNSLNKLKYDVASSNFAIWHEHYISENYEEIDSTFDKIHCTSLPTLWNVEDQLKRATSSKERQMRLDSRAFGATKGISIPIHGYQEDFACFLVVQMKDETCLDDWPNAQYELFTIAYYYYSYLQKLLLKNQTPVEKYQLQKRELQCLHLIAKQYSVTQISQSLNITVRTVNYHIQRLNKKLGAKNKYQSVMKALQHGLLEL
jgi:LuxR family transcriptional activator of bioluminescence operon